MAGVDDDLLAELGPVHPTVAEQLATGARVRVAADFGVGVTGVAGPGSQGGRPVGEVHVGVAWHGGVSSRGFHLDGTRGDIRAAAASVALQTLVAELERHAGKSTS